MRVVKPARAERSAAKDARREVRAGCHRRPRASHRTGRRKFIPDRPRRARRPSRYHARFDTRNHFSEFSEPKRYSGSHSRLAPFRILAGAVLFRASWRKYRKSANNEERTDSKRRRVGKNLKAGPRRKTIVARTRLGTRGSRAGRDAHERGPARASAARVAAMDSEEAILRWLEPDESGASGAETHAPDLNLTLRSRVSRLVVVSPRAHRRLTAPFPFESPSSRPASLEQPRRCCPAR